MSRLRSGRWVMPAAYTAGAALLLVAAPASLSVFNLGLLGKFICFAIVAVGIGLAWGRGGMLTLGQGVFFGLGAYIMAMHMKLADAALFGGSGVPDFMNLYGNGEVPGWWEPFRSPALTVLAVILGPGTRGAGPGAGHLPETCERGLLCDPQPGSRCRLAVLLIGQQSTTGGSNGLSGFRSFFGFDLQDPSNKADALLDRRGGAGAGVAGRRAAHAQPVRGTAGGSARPGRTGPVPGL